jgi:hypothetical protein
MESPDAFIRSKINDDRHVRWPTDEREREELAQTLFGLMFIETLDGWIKTAEDWLNNPEPSRPFQREWSQLAKMDRTYRTVFQAMNEDQRKTVSRLLRHAISGALFSALASIDQFPYGQFEISFVDEKTGERVLLAPGWQFLHDRFHEWQKQFSAYPRDDGSAT